MSIWIVVSTVAVASFFLGVACVLFWAFPKLESYFVFRPTREISRTPADVGIPFRELYTTTEDGCRLTLWHLRPESPKASILYFHGNSGNLGLYNEIFRHQYEEGFEVLAVDYRGYGSSSGFPSEEGLYRDARAAVDYCTAQISSGSSAPLVYWGRSLGGVAAASAASYRAPDALILESTFPSKRELLQYFPQFRPFRLFSRYRLHTVRFLGKKDYPVLVLHGEQDRTIPVELGRSLYGQLEMPKRLEVVPGADHVNIHRLNREEYFRRIRAFLEGEDVLRADR